ncbi:MAG: bifunctional glutamate N-acetyltransferase/amino-acid acetyltransferase ArgJ [Candidatus Omnitrophota bacterium]
MKELKKGTISTPLGFKTNALWCGLKKKKFDLALIYSIVRARSAGVFTRNKVKAAPVELGIKNLKDNHAQAIIINSGNANCCTGKRGKEDALLITKLLAAQLKLKTKDVLMSSTGVIGKYLAKEKIISSLPELAGGLGFNNAHKTAQAIMTTDTFSKQVAVEIKIKNKPVTVAAVAKGAGMICPNMATMLCFVTTDANIEQAALKKALKTAVDASFNCISIDGQMSTNDSVIIMANGLAANAMIRENSRESGIFVQALKHVCLELAKMIIKDAEGATKFIEINIKGARNRKAANTAAMAIANSMLVKTMIAGNNPNWGRIPAALGAAGIDLDQEKMELSLQKKVVYKNAKPVLKDQLSLINSLKKKDINITVNLNNGSFEHTVFSSDLTVEYVKVNMAYN